MSSSESGSRRRSVIGRLGRLRLFGKAFECVRRPRERDLAAGPVTYVSKKITAAQFMRRMRKARANIFRNNYNYDGGSDNRVYINSTGDSYSWTDKSYGCVWVAVHGTQCMSVAFKGTLDPSCYPHLSIDSVHRFYSLNVISEIEDIILSTNPDSRGPLDMLVTQPFGIVSSIQSSTNVQDSGDEVSVALEYLKKSLEGRTKLTRYETLQIAVTGLQRLCNQQFKAGDKFWVVRLVDEGDSYLLPELLEKLLADINTTEEIKEEHFSVTNKPLQTENVAVSLPKKSPASEKGHAKPLVSRETRRPLATIDINVPRARYLSHT